MQSFNERIEKLEKKLDIYEEEYTMANITRIKDLSAITSVADSDVLPVDGANGTKGVTFGNLSTAILNKLTGKTFGMDQGT